MKFRYIPAVPTTPSHIAASDSGNIISVNGLVIDVITEGLFDEIFYNKILPKKTSFDDTREHMNLRGDLLNTKQELFGLPKLISCVRNAKILYRPNDLHIDSLQDIVEWSNPSKIRNEYRCFLPHIDVSKNYTICDEWYAMLYLLCFNNGRQYDKHEWQEMVTCLMEAERVDKLNIIMDIIS
jgi:hypothetical protein